MKLHDVRRPVLGGLQCGLRASIGLLWLVAGCAPPTDVIDVSVLPQTTQDAMLRVQILPLGMSAPPNVGSVGQLEGYGCGNSPTDAAASAIQQLQAKALQRQATAVMSVVLSQAAPAGCWATNAVTASGIAVANRGIPPTW